MFGLDARLRIKHQIITRAQGVFRVIQHMCRPKAAHHVDLARRGRRGHVRTHGHRDLHRQMSDAARARMDEHALPRLDLAMHDQPLPNGQPGQRQRARLRIRHAIRDMHHLVRRGCDMACVGRRLPRKAWHAEHPVTRCKSRDARPDGQHTPHHIPPHSEGRIAQQRKIPRPHHRIDRVDACCRHLHQNLA